MGPCVALGGNQPLGEIPDLSAIEGRCLGGRWKGQVEGAPGSPQGGQLNFLPGTPGGPVPGEAGVLWPDSSLS